MREERTIHLVDVPIGGKDGFVWNRLHGDREEICEALAKEKTESSRRILQTRLRTLESTLEIHQVRRSTRLTRYREVFQEADWEDM